MLHYRVTKHRRKSLDIRRADSRRTVLETSLHWPILDQTQAVAKRNILHSA
jgi:hypothetical protein